MKKSIKEQNQLAAIARLEKGLNSQDKQIIKLICLEHTTEEIGSILGKSKRTIDNCRIAIIKIIGCRNVVGVVKYAIKNKLV